AGKSRPTAKPPARSPRTFNNSPNSPNCSPTPRSWRPATTGPTAAPGGNAVSEKTPPRQLPVPGNSPADQLPAPTGQYDVDGRICEANVARSLLLRKIDEPPQSPPVQAVRARPFGHVDYAITVDSDFHLPELVHPKEHLSRSGLRFAQHHLRPAEDGLNLLAVHADRNSR